MKRPMRCGIYTAGILLGKLVYLRRLVERGVPFITINYRGWDTHKKHFEIMRQKLPELDKGFSALCRICMIMDF